MPVRGERPRESYSPVCVPYGSLDHAEPRRGDLVRTQCLHDVAEGIILGSILHRVVKDGRQASSPRTTTWLATSIAHSRQVLQSFCDEAETVTQIGWQLTKLEQENWTPLYKHQFRGHNSDATARLSVSPSSLAGGREWTSWASWLAKAALGTLIPFQTSAQPEPVKSQCDEVAKGFQASHLGGLPSFRFTVANALHGGDGGAGSAGGSRR
jgi:hypothetical protein